MRIAMLSANFPPYFGGIGNVCFYNAVELVKLGHDVTVYTSNFPDKKMIYPKGLKVRRLRPLFRFRNAFCMPQLVGLKDYDLVHLHLPFHFGAEFALLVSKARRIPIVSTYQMDLVGERWLKVFFKLHEKTFLKLVLKNSKKNTKISL